MGLNLFVRIPDDYLLSKEGHGRRNRLMILITHMRVFGGPEMESRAPGHLDSRGVERYLEKWPSPDMSCCCHMQMYVLIVTGAHRARKLLGEKSFVPEVP